MINIFPGPNSTTVTQNTSIRQLAFPAGSIITIFVLLNGLFVSYTPGAPSNGIGLDDQLPSNTSLFIQAKQALDYIGRLRANGKADNLRGKFLTTKNGNYLVAKNGNYLGSK